MKSWYTFFFIFCIFLSLSISLFPVSLFLYFYFCLSFLYTLYSLCSLRRVPSYELLQPGLKHLSFIQIYCQRGVYIYVIKQMRQFLFICATRSQGSNADVSFLKCGNIRLKAKNFCTVLGLFILYPELWVTKNEGVFHVLE